jgi:hypothetical protein
MLSNQIVEQEIKNWIHNYLDKPSKHYGGNKPCPFARSAFDAGEVHVLVGNSQILWDIVTTWDDWFRVVVVCIPEEESNDIEAFCDSKNKFFVEARSDLILIPFLPSEEDPEDPDLDPDDWGQITDEAYTMVFVQRVHEINKFSKILESRGYYERVSPEFWDWVQQRRKLSEGISNA